MRFFCRREPSEPMLNPIRFYLRPEGGTTWVNAFVAGLITLRAPPILQVVRLRADPKVAPAIVEHVPIDVIDNLLRLRRHDQSMEQHQRPLGGTPAYDARRTARAGPVKPPLAIAKQWQYVVIDMRHCAAAELDFQRGLQKKSPAQVAGLRIDSASSWAPSAQS